MKLMDVAGLSTRKKEERWLKVYRKMERNREIYLQKDRQKIQALIVQKEQRDKTFQGTPTVEVWGKDISRSCEQFIRFMKRHDFHGATALTSPTANRGERSIRGYGIGCVGVGRRRSWENPNFEEKVDGDQYENLPYTVFLCEDNTLRLYSGRGTGGESEIHKRYSPLILSSLPVDESGSIMPPVLGRLEYYHVARESFMNQDFNEVYVDTGNEYAHSTRLPIGNPYRVTIPAYTKIVFRPSELDLESVLEQYANEAENSEYTKRYQ